MNSVDRRSLFKGSGLAAFALAGPLGGLMAEQAKASTNAQGAQTAPAASPYGPIAPVRDLATGLFLLQLPSGFSYRSMSWTNDLMSDGNRVNGAHDGMAVVRVGTGRNPDTFLIRNHELGGGRAMTVNGNPGAFFDNTTISGQSLAGGCTVLRVRGGQLVESYNTLGGTIVNCAGGKTLWNSWLSCEETTNGTANGLNQNHGYVFDVSTNPLQTVATPIRDMGRFSHEATATDPVTNYIYQTEDARNNAAFYRFKPNDTSRTYGSLSNGGVLQAAKVVGIDKANLLALAGTRPSDVAQVGQAFAIEWVTIPTPDSPPTTNNETGINNPDTGVRNVSGPFRQARDRGALRMSRGEGLWYHNGVIYITDTSFGYESSGNPPRAGRGLGCVWAYRPSTTNPDQGTLTLVYAAANRIAGNNPDNICVSPTGGILYMEDGSAVVDEFGAGNRVMGLTNAGLAYIFCKNNVQLSAANLAATGRTGQVNPGDYRGFEFCGGTFDPSGRTFYVNIQTPGITFAITGPWARGNL
ncbi:hypothetical protein IP88_01810 [alpha proteobacterium AAP81b]|nr:hypothetical protein IP88_01810 [alpha proteobacterium AAP81b]